MADANRHADRVGGGEALCAPSPVVLLADDQGTSRATIAFHLAMAGYPVVEAESVAGAVAGAREVHPDIVVISDDLEDGDVGTVLASIADVPDLAGVPVITLSSHPGTDRLVECLSLGARDHVRRQDGAVELVARVDAVLRADEELERLRRRNAELEFLGTVDPLTGMGNRRYLEEELDRLAAGACRHGLALSAVMVRLDELPATHSPLRRRQREAVLRELSYLLAAVQRTEDISGSWDDRTFVVLLPMTPLWGARSFAGRLRAVVRSAPVRSGDALVPVTISAACAEVGERGTDVLRRLEQGVMAAQANGGDGLTG